jgi:threonylcarbamoyladenosine tRNA methylthiotransferase MtaB
MDGKKRKVAFHTLGCKLNFAETSTLARSFPEEKFERVPAASHADIYVINTCSVTETADRKCRQAIKKFIHQSPEALIAVVGCYAQLNPGKIASIPGVDLILGTNEKFGIADYISSISKKGTPEVHSCGFSEKDAFNPSFSAGDRTRSFMKVQDGCDYNCSYCTIPRARGKSRNQEISSLVEEAGKIAGREVREIVLTGVNIGDFGKSTGESFASLMSELVKVNGIERFRISSIEPNLLTDELIQITASEPKIMPHFHIPLQSGTDRILGLMRRRYRRYDFRERVNAVKSEIPNAGIGADVIVGFPGETDEDFEETYRFLADLPLSYLHVFNFSERPGTEAQKMNGKVPFSIREKRSRRLITLSEEKHLEFCRQNEGNISFVLFEHAKNAGMINGFTENYIKAEYPWSQTMAGKILKVKLGTISPSGKVTAEVIK